MPNKLKNFAQQYSLATPIIIQAPMAGGITTPQLVAAVSQAHGVGSFATGYLTTDQVQTGIRAIKQLTQRCYAVNVFIPGTTQHNADHIKDYQRALNLFRQELGMTQEEDIPASLLLEDNFAEIIELLLAENVPVVSFTFGNLPKKFIQAFKAKGTYLIGTATSVAEGKILAESGIDAIVAQGYEAGGHRGSFFTPVQQATMGSMTLIPQMVRSIDKPVIAAGGMMNGAGIVAAGILGAAAVQLGTAFLTTVESGANPVYKEELINAQASSVDTTTLTNVYSGKMARSINTRFVEQMKNKVTTIPDYPIPNILSGPVRKAALQQKATDLMFMLSGQGVPLISKNLTAAALLKQLRDEIIECGKVLCKDDE